MKSYSKTTRSDRTSRIFNLGELLFVFLPALLFIKIMGAWVGEDSIRNLIVVWVANVVMLALVWTGLKLRGQSWEDFGLTLKPVGLARSLKIFGLSLVVFVIGITAYLIGPVLLLNFTEVQQHADFSRYEFLKGNPGSLLMALVAVYIVSSFGEEVIYRGFLITRITQLAGTSKYGGAIAIIISSVFFGAIHYEWGLMGMIQTGCMGLAMGLCYVRLRKRLWILILAHAYMDTILLVQLYLASNAN